MRICAALVTTALLAGCAGSNTTAARPSPSAAASPSPDASPTPITPTTPSPPKNTFQLTSIAAGLNSPDFLTSARDGSGRLFIVEQVGRIRVVRDGRLLPTPFLDIRSLVEAGGERGLLSVAFHPDFKTNGVFIVNYTRASSTAADVGDTVIARYRVATSGADVADAATGETLLVIDQPQPNHNGGLVMFGPDGMLYIGMGDGGAGSDVGPGHAPQGNGQSLTTLLGKLLRIRVGETGPYEIPVDNPNLGAGTRREIWDYGLRNPWRFSFDRATGDLYIGDVGQNNWEEIDFESHASNGGVNYGWPVWEGNHVYRSGVALSGDTKPVAEYSHANGQCSVTGGYVYRGSTIALNGYYILGDYCAGRLWTLADVGGRWYLTPLMDTGMLIASFGEDEAGELYLVNLSGSVYRFDPR